jgi:hypothetical protein
MSVSPITSISAPDQQHLLFLCLPLKTGTSTANDPMPAINALFSGQPGDAASDADPRPATGVHFYMAYVLRHGDKPTTPPPFPVFQVPPPNPEGKPRDLAIVMSIYDADFGPYIGAFTRSPAFSALLDETVLKNLDEGGFADPNKPPSAQWILKHGGTFANQTAFVQLLMRYNWADPTIPAATNLGTIKTPNPKWKYFLGATFPGMTNTKILGANGYPNAAELWPTKNVVIDYARSIPPV